MKEFVTYKKFSLKLRILLHTQIHRNLLLLIFKLLCLFMFTHIVSHLAIMILPLQQITYVVSHNSTVGRHTNIYTYKYIQVQ